MKIIKANAEYTGGGIYRYTAQTDAGTWLVGNSEWDVIYEVDADPDETEDSWYNEWYDEHQTAEHEQDYIELLSAMLGWILMHEPDGNYDTRDIRKYLQEELDDHDTEVRIVEYYSEQGDITFIMMETYLRLVPIKSEVVGFYYGKPNKEDTEQFKNRGTVAYYE